MSSTAVTIIAEGDFRAAEPNQVLIEAGSTITFTGAAQSSTVLVLTETTAALLSPAPSSEQVEIGAGASVTFTFGQPADEGYCCQVVSTDSAAHPITCPPSEESAILTILASDRDLPPPVGHSSGR